MKGYGCSPKVNTQFSNGILGITPRKNYHCENCPSELEIQSGYSNISVFCKSSFNIKVFNVQLCTYQHKNTRGVNKGKPMDFDPEVKIEVIGDTIFYKL